jgi:neutral trehalase
VEKYDVVRLRADIDRSIQFGYRTNEAGFGWTNAVFTALFDELPPNVQRGLIPRREREKDHTNGE